MRSCETFDTPVLLIGFNRPKAFNQVLTSVLNINPRALFIALDGPREGRADDLAACRAVRQLAEQGSVVPDFTIDASLGNMGCGKRVSTALNRFFDKFPEGIVLEDDTIPSPDFFRFCASALRELKDRPDIGHIAGSRFEQDESRYAFNRTIHAHIWGWATWRERWAKYDFSCSGYANAKVRRQAQKFVADKEIWESWCDAFERVRSARVDTWDYQWTFSCWQHGWHGIVPPVNLVQNVGFDNDATHTRYHDNSLSLSQRLLPANVEWKAVGARDWVRDRGVQESRYGFMPRHSYLRLLVRRAWWKLKAKGN